MSESQAYKLWQQSHFLEVKLAKRSRNKHYTKANQLRYLRLFQRAHMRSLRRWNIYEHHVRDAA